MAIIRDRDGMAVGTPTGTTADLLEGAYDILLEAHNDSVWVDIELSRDWDRLHRSITRLKYAAQWEVVRPGLVYPALDLLQRIQRRMYLHAVESKHRTALGNMTVVYAHLWQVWQEAQREFPDESAFSL